MKQTSLRLVQEVRLPVEAESISPDRFEGLSRAELAALPLLVGRRKRRIGDLFEVEGEGSDHLVLEGDLGHVKRIGEAMSRGKIEIRGRVGMHLGARMSGGEIEVQGDVEAWAGAHMRGGLLRVRGSAGPMLGAAYTGERLGMRGGVILVEGSAGIRAGERMRRGLVVIGGDAGDLAGARMVAGSLICLGRLGARPGANMKRGTLVSLGGLREGVLPTFNLACTFHPVFLRYYWLWLQQMGVPVAEQMVEGRYRRYTGDLNTIGKGEILVYDQH